MHKIHAIFTGFPLAVILLLIVIEVLNFYNYFEISKTFIKLKHFLLFSYLASVLLTFSTGYLADFFIPDLKEESLFAFESHYFFAKLVLFISLLPLFLKVLETSKIKSKPFYKFYILSLILNLLVIVVIGFYGGELVFTHGVGVVEK